MSSKRSAVLVVLASVAVSLWLIAGQAGAGALVEFPNVSERSQPPHLLGYLVRPDGPGPFAAVVVLHGCNGFSGASATIADRLKSLGYVALTVDSLGPRNSWSECGHFFVEQATDAYAALRYLSEQPFVDPNRVAVLGNSMGGSSALFDVERGAIEKLFDRKFRAAIAYYPSCRGHSAIISAPTLILIGEADDWNPAAACREMSAQPHDAGAQIDLYVYPGAYHGFNFRELQPGIRVLGHWLEYNEPAALDAWERVRDFLAEHLANPIAKIPDAR
jgi:dienelactone hydrolase